MIDKALKLKFESIIEIKNLDWEIMEEVAMSDSNILRPIKGVAFEEYFKKIVLKNYPHAKFEDGVGDSDIDFILNGYKLQLKTPDKGTTREGVKVGVALHKTHGDETRPNNLYKSNNPTFDFLVAFHPQSGIFIIPYNEIPRHNKYPEHLADPAQFDWNSEWLNHWELLGFDNSRGKTLDDRTVPQDSELPLLSAETFLEDFEIIEMLCKPQYFRAAVMGLKGNIKEHWFKYRLRELNYHIEHPTESYAKYDVKLLNKRKELKRVQVKGTSKNMCSIEKMTIGFEIMGTHGQFPSRGYKKSSLDYVAIIISEDQLPNHFPIESGLHFILINIEDLPLHSFIGNGIEGKEKGTLNYKWNDPNYNDVLYPNIKLKYQLVNDEVHFYPHIESYKNSNGLSTIHEDSNFRKAGPFILNRISEEF
jgi:hypothetical protein